MHTSKIGNFKSSVMYQKTRLRLNEKLSLMLRNCSLVAQTEEKKRMLC